MRTAKMFLVVAFGLCLTACNPTASKRLGQAWTIQTEATTTMARLTEDEIIDKEDAEEYLEYDRRALIVLDAATESLIENPEDTDGVQNAVEFVDPLLAAMQEILADYEGSE